MITLTQYNIIPLISFVLYALILIIILTSNKTRLSKAFSLYVIAMIIWSLGSFLMKTEVPPSSLFWNKVLQIGFISVPVLLLRLSYILSGEYDRKFIIWLGYFLSIVMIILAMMGYVIPSGELVNGRFVYETSWGAYVFGVIGSFYTILAIAMMVSKILNGDVPSRKHGLIIIGLTLVFLGAASNLSSTIGEYGIDILLNTVNAFLITFSIYRNKFLEINLIVKRGLSISVYNIFLYTAYALLIILSYNILYNQFLVRNTYLILLLMSPVFLLLEPIRLLLRRFTSHIFYRGTSDRQIVLREFSDLINSSLQLTKITGTIIESLIKAIGTKDVHVFLKNTTKYKLRDSSNQNIDHESSFIKFNHPVITWFQNGNKLLLKTQIDNHVIFKGLWDSEKEMLSRLDAEILVPIRYLDDLIGVVVITGRTDETPYSFEETEFLETIINNAAAIIENAKTIELIKRQSITDELTKFYNHRYFQETANNYISNGNYTKFSLAMIDIDQFRIYNDLYGHSSGDIALKRIAEIIQQNTSQRDMLVRFAGEEFVVLYPNMGGNEAFFESEKIREAVEEEFLLSKDIREFLTVTIGVASFPDNGRTLEEVISRSDQSVRLGKQSGRNKTILYREDVSQNNVDSQVQKKIKDAFISSIYALAATIDAKDHYTYGHSNNVSVLSEALAKAAKFSNHEIEIVRNAGLLHDIGKVGIPEVVLSKPGFLNPDEYEIMKGHVIQSINIIKHIPNLVDTIPAIISHHERYDGKGYPRGIKGENIPILGRVICIADAFDAMTTDRPYRQGLSLEQAIYELNKNAGTQFDPELVQLFITMAKSDTLVQLSLENRPSFN